jgi:hypothetical protein
MRPACVASGTIEDVLAAAVRWEADETLSRAKPLHHHHVHFWRAITNPKPHIFALALMESVRHMALI